MHACMTVQFSHDPVIRARLCKLARVDSAPLKDTGVAEVSGLLVSVMDSLLPDQVCTEGCVRTGTYTIQGHTVCCFINHLSYTRP